MTLDLRVYLKEEPDFAGPLSRFLRLQLRDDSDTKYYVWQPEDSEYPVHIDMEVRARTPCHQLVLGEHAIDAEVEATKRGGYQVPDSFIEKVNRDRGYVRADIELYEILRQHPNLGEGFPDLQEIFGVAQFTEGRPAYTVHFQTNISTPLQTIGGMTRIACFL